MKKYLVDVYFIAREDSWTEKKLETDSPQKAIEKWAELELVHDYATSVSINAYKKEHVMELMQYAHDNEEWLHELCNKEKFPYKWEYIRDAIEQNIRLECCTFHETCINGDYYRDMVHPFDIG